MGYDVVVVGDCRELHMYWNGNIEIYQAVPLNYEYNAYFAQKSLVNSPRVSVSFYFL